ncbi:MAG: hypothetical protein C4537_01795 [Acholeplasma sp.]|jgi:hypothetical protein|nr:MAG: hypothetical protein C4537_01795 [Acholeplasma sp.]
MIHSSEYRLARYGMIALAILYILLFLMSILIRNPFFQFPGYLLSSVAMIIFLILIIFVHPLNRRLMIIPYVLSQIGVIIYSYEPTRFILNAQINTPMSWIGFGFHLISIALGLLAMILPLFIFLRKDIYQKPFIILAISAFIFQMMSRMWYGVFLLTNIEWILFYVNSIRFILSFIPFVSIILYAIDAKKIHQVLNPTDHLKEDSDDDELFGWLTLGIYTIYLAVTKPYKK